MARDYYEILGVARDATADQIRSAHRKLARKYHPDLNKAANAAAMFKETQDAYDILSDAGKRAKYDRFGHAGEQQSNMGGGNAGGYGGVDADTLESIFGNFMGGGGRGRGKRARSATRRGFNLHNSSWIYDRRVGRNASHRFARTKRCDCA